MIKNCAGYILYCCLVYFIGYIVFALFTQKASTLLVPCIFLNVTNPNSRFHRGGKLRKYDGIFTIVMGNLEMLWDFFSKVLSTLKRIILSYEKVGKIIVVSTVGYQPYQGRTNCQILKVSAASSMEPTRVLFLDTVRGLTVPQKLQLH